MSNRLIAYIDGFNLYRGMMAAGMRRFLWLDLTALIKNLRPKNSEVTEIKYVTARILNRFPPGDPRHAKEEASRRRQSEFIDAQLARGVRVFEGKFKRRDVRCHACGATWVKPEEKASDVHLATQLLADAFRKSFDVAMIVSGDADVAPAVQIVVGDLGLPVIIAFPPHRVLEELKAVATGFRHINRHIIAKSQLPKTLVHEGHTFRRPGAWS